LISDNWGPINTLAISATYAFHISVGGERKISAGFSIGNYYRTINSSNGSFDVSNPNDVLLNSDGKLSVNHNLINIGATYYNRSNYIGVSALQPIMETFNFTNKNGDTTNTHNSFGQMPSVFTLQAGTSTNLNEDLTLYPTCLIKYINKYQWTAEATLRASFKESAWAGISYRLKESIGIHAGARLSPSLLVNYSYDFQGNLGPFTRSLSSNEITIAYMFYMKGLK
jgi:type IX secretion system PorP/SprF family membrane protein